MPDQLWQFYPWMHVTGRILFTSFPLIFGLTHLVRPRDATAYLERRGVPGAMPVAIYTGLMLVAGSLMVLLGWHRFIGAGLLFLVLFPGAFALHAFWNEPDAHARRSERAQFFMTLALAGGSLIVGFYGHLEWPLAVGH